MRPDDLDRHLVTGERRVIKVRRHPAALLGALGRATAALLVALGLLWFVPGEATVVTSVLWYASVAVLVLLGHQVLQWWVERIVVTDRRVLLSSGVFVTRVAMMPLTKVTDLTFEHSVSGRAMGYFTMVVESAGQSQGLSRIEFLPAPERLRSSISELLFGDGRGEPDPDEHPTVRLPRLDGSGAPNRRSGGPH